MPISSVVLVILLGIAAYTDSQPKNQLLLSVNWLVVALLMMCVSVCEFHLIYDAFALQVFCQQLHGCAV
jgi:hypothetical protein